MAMEKHFIQEGIIRSEIESFLKGELEGAGYSGIDIQKTPLATRVVLYVEKPPLVIGKKGRRINKLTRALKEKYGIDNPAIDVQAVDKPTLDPNIVARRIAVALEKGMNRRRVAYKAIRSAMATGAQGIEITIAGKIIGKGGRARAEKYLQGYMRKVGDSAKLVRTGSTQAYLKAGIIGVTVKIVPPDVVFPDNITINKVGAAPEEKEGVKATEKAPEKGAEASTDESKTEAPETKKETASKESKEPVKDKAEPVEQEKSEATKDKKEADKKETKEKTDVTADESPEPKKVDEEPAEA